jgi:hypothetical protein
VRIREPFPTGAPGENPFERHRASRNRQETENRAEFGAQESGIAEKRPSDCTPHVPKRSNLGEAEDISSSGARLLPSLQLRGLMRKTCWRPVSSSLFQLAGSSAFFLKGFRRAIWRNGRTDKASIPIPERVAVNAAIAGQWPIV